MIVFVWVMSATVSNMSYKFVPKCDQVKQLLCNARAAEVAVHGELEAISIQAK